MDAYGYTDQKLYSGSKVKNALKTSKLVTPVHIFVRMVNVLFLTTGIPSLKEPRVPYSPGT